MGRPQTWKERQAALAAESEKISERIRDRDEFPDAGGVWRAMAKQRSSQPYVTGMTALNIPFPGRTAPDWHSHALVNQAAWTWSGELLMDTTHLIGMCGVYDATDALRQFAPETLDGTLAASYERAVFDLLYHFAIKDEPVPNIQAKDIDHEVDFKQVIRWIETCELLPTDRKVIMLAWLEISDW